jgi:4-hydroxy-tetrahydrodipicolinate synthase
MSKSLSGTGVALVTPFDQTGAIDFEALSNLVEHIINNGVNYLVVLGTTAETATLSKEEKKQVLAHVLKVNNARVPVVLGHGGNNTQELINQFSEYDFSQIDAILSVSPYYNKPTQEGIYQHYKAICAHSPVPVILYNVPGRTASNISADTTLRLAKEFKNIIGIKEASGSMEQIMKILNHKPKDFMVISGDDALTLPMIACGAEGVISVVANAYPKEFSSLVNDSLSGDFKSARINHFKLLEIIDNLFVEGNPAGIKASLKIRNLSHDHLRLPLVNVSEATYNKLKQLHTQL